MNLVAAALGMSKQMPVFNDADTACSTELDRARLCVAWTLHFIES